MKPLTLAILILLVWIFIILPVMTDQSFRLIQKLQKRNPKRVQIKEVENER